MRDLRPSNDNAPVIAPGPRTACERLLDDCYARLNEAIPGIYHDRTPLAATFATFMENLVLPLPDRMTQSELLCLLGDFETVLQPFRDGEAAQLQFGAAHLLLGIADEEGLELATQCALYQFSIYDEQREIFAREGLIDPALPVGLGLIDALERAHHAQDVLPLAIHNSARMLADYLTTPGECSLPKPNCQRLDALAEVGMDYDPSRLPSRAALVRAPVVKLAVARRYLSGGPHG